MASFTDTQIPKFNPYIQQQPVEAMVTVGVGKQKAHDEGVQKIQTQIDNIAGLDVVRDVDKAYLQSKINELGNGLRTVASGDFGNFQLVNSVGGMIKQIGYDKNVQNAVQSAAKYRKEAALLEKDIEAGKENPANTAHFQKNAGKWLNSSELKQSFNAKYITPKDVWGKIKDIAAAVGVDEQTVQQLYQTDEQGNYIMKDGKPVWNNVMVEKTLKGKDASKILKAFEMGLTPADYQQLNINGEYQYSGLDSVALKERVVTEAKQQTDFNDKKILDLKTALLQENQKNNKDQERIQSISDQIEYFENSNEKVKSSLERNIKSAEENPDAVRGSLYTNDYMHSMSKSLASQDVSTKYSVSPLFTITMEQNRFNRDLQRDRIADQHWAIEQQNAQLKAAGEREDKALEMFLKYKVKLPGLKLPPGFDAGTERLNEPITEANKDAAKVAVEDDYASSVEDLNSTNYNLTLQYFKQINKKLPNEDNDAYTLRMKKAIDKYARGNKEEAADFKTGDINTFTSRFAAKQLQDWAKNPENVPAEFRSLIKKQVNLSQELEIQKEEIKDVKKQAIIEGKKQGLHASTEEEVKKNLHDTEVYIDPNTNRRHSPEVNGKTFHLSKQDVIDFANLHPEAYNIFGSWTVDSGQEARRDLSRKRLELKYGKQLKGLDNYLYDVHFTQSEFGRPSQYYGSIHPVIKQAGKYMNSSDYQKLAKIESQLYVDRGVVKQPSSVTLYRGEEKPEDFTARIFAVISKYDSDGKILASKGINREDFQEAVLTSDKKAAKIISTPGVGNAPVKHTLLITAGKNKPVEMIIDNDDYRALTGTEPPENAAIPRVAKLINAHGTTNTSGDPSGAHWASEKFTRFKSKKYDITGDLVKDEAIPNVAHMKVYLWDKQHPHDEPKVVTIPSPITMTNPDGSYDNILDYLPSGVTEANVEQFIKEQ